MYDRNEASDHVGVDLDVDGVCVGIDGDLFEVLAVRSLGEVGEIVTGAC